jgi:hypothetical protein
MSGLYQPLTHPRGSILRQVEMNNTVEFTLHIKMRRYTQRLYKVSAHIVTEGHVDGRDYVASFVGFERGPTSRTRADSLYQGALNRYGKQGWHYLDTPNQPGRWPVFHTMMGFRVDMPDSLHERIVLAQRLASGLLSEFFPLEKREELLEVLSPFPPGAREESRVP